MSKFIKSLAVISALAIFATGFTSCKNDEDNDSNTSTTNTGFEGTYYNINVINQLKTVSGQNKIPYAQCSVTEVIFNKDGTGTYKLHQEEYYGGDIDESGMHTNVRSESISYTKSDQTLKFTVENEPMEFTIESDDKLVCEDDREYNKGAIEEIYAYLNIDTSENTVTNKVIILGKGGSANFRNLVTKFYDFQRAPTIEEEKKEATYTKSEKNIKLTLKHPDAETDAEINGTFSTDEDFGITYLTIGEEKYRKL